jgi:hypothetical protein
MTCVVSRLYGMGYSADLIMIIVERGKGLIRKDLDERNWEDGKGSWEWWGDEGGERGADLKRGGSIC